MIGMVDKGGLDDDYIAELLARAAADPASPDWHDLWNELCHQGDVCEESYTSLPALTAMARRWSGADRKEPLALAAAILTSPRGFQGLLGAPRAVYAAEIAELLALAEELLSQTDSSDDYLQVMLFVLGFEDVPVWGEHFDGVREGEYCVECPHCRATNYVAFAEGFYLSTQDLHYNRNTATKRHPLMPAEAAELVGIGARLHARAIADGFPEVATRLTHVFGRARCAACDEVFGVADAVIAP